jgi:hypothetical protein
MIPASESLVAFTISMNFMAVSWLSSGAVARALTTRRATARPIDTAVEIFSNFSKALK